MCNLWRVSCIILGVCFSCISSNEKFYIENINGQWKADKPIKFVVEVLDSENLKNISLVIRNNKDYKYRNLYLQISMFQQGGKYRIVEKLNYNIAKPSGVWDGIGFGEIKEVLGRYKTDYKFPSNAKYEIEIKHLMNTDSLVGIEDVGIKIETLKL